MDMLSDKEIDLLLGSLVDFGLEKKKQIKNFNLVKDSFYNHRSILRILEIFLDKYARYTEKELRNEFCMTNIEVINSEIFSSEEFLTCLGEFDILYTMNLYPLKDSCFLIVSMNLIDEMSKYYLENINYHTYDIQELKKILMEEIFEIFTNNLSKTWIDGLEIRPVLRSIQSSNKNITFDLKQGKLIMITMEIKIERKKFYIQFVLPYISIYPIIKYFNYEKLYKRQQTITRETNKQTIMKHISNIDLTISSVCKKNVYIDDLINIQQGDIILLDERNFENPEILVNNIPKFKGKLLSSNNKLYVKLESELV